MDTVSDVPFDLHMIKTVNEKRDIKKASLFFYNEKAMWKNDTPTLIAEENDAIKLYFNSDDKDARLYLDALDIMPIDDKNTKIDEDGNIYRISMNQEFTLYEHNNNYDELRVDTFKLTVKCNGIIYYGTFQINPKQMSQVEWNIMRNDLEREINGLAQDIVRRNIGIGDFEKGFFPPKLLYDFFVIKRYSKKVLMSLIDIAENPRSKIITQYEKVSSNTGKNYAFDTETIKQYVKKGGAITTFNIPKKSICYDIQENRLLKNIIGIYEEKLDSFIDALNKSINRQNSFYKAGTHQYQQAWDESITEFRKIAVKLRKLTSILKSKDWYLSVGEIKNPFIPHSFIMDARYNIMYQMYMDFKKDQLQIELDPEYSYTWKRSSYLYEMWTYLKMCNILSLHYLSNEKDHTYLFMDKILFPYLSNGSKTTYEDEEIKIELIFDTSLPLEKTHTSYDKPLYMARNSNNSRMHYKPDILINVYEKKKDWYIGSIIIECKYRKLSQFWYESSERNSREQIETYYNNTRSQFLYGELNKTIQGHPVRKVFVLTPDLRGDGKEHEDFKTTVLAAKPSEHDALDKNFSEELLNEIRQIKDAAKRLTFLC